MAISPFFFPRRNASLVLLITVIAAHGCEKAAPSATGVPSTALQDDPRFPKVTLFCGHCHAFPQPSSFPRHEWAAEVTQGFRFYEGAQNLHLDVPSEEEVVAFYQLWAPESIATPESGQVEVNGRFLRQSPAAHTATVSVSDLSVNPPSRQILATDMRTGAILSSDSSGLFSEVARPVQLSNPGRLTTVDMDQDGQVEILASDLGSFFPQDHQNGSVWKLEPHLNWKATNILQGVSRVCDVQPGDLDGDGDMDLVVAEFGWRRTGRVLILWNEQTPSGEAWRHQVLDPRHGAIDVPVLDLNQDGLLDICSIQPGVRDRGGLLESRRGPI